MLAVDGHDATGVECLLSKVHARSNGGSATSDLTRAFDVDGNTLLHRCAAGPSSVSEEGKDGEKVVEFLVAARADVNNSNLLGETPLLAAARGRPSVGVVSALLRARADPNHPDTIASETALMELACQGETNLCRLLLESHADGLLRNRHGRNARDLAIENRHSEVVLLFGEFGITADAAGAPAVDLDALQAVQRCDLERMQGLLSDLTDHECQKLLTRGVDDSGRQLLHIAASKGSEEDAADMARLLLDYGAPMGGADFAGETPLSLAVAASLDAVLRGTVEGEKGASKDGSAWAALDTIRVLLVAGASPSDAIGLSSSTSKLREALQEHPEDVADLCRLLQAFGAEFQTDAEDPDADASEDRDFTEDRESVPPDLEKRLGSLGAKVVMASCSKWRQMNAKQLRAECAEVGIPTDGCVEKGELIERLRQLRIWQAMPLSVLQEACADLLGHFSFTRFLPFTQDLLLVSMYNGRSRRDRILEMCKSKNIPIDKLSDLNKAEVVLKQVKRFEEGSVSDLKREPNT
ncbi:Putative ankyrin repeat protein RF_0381 [Durusdinium trenchii]|uniref:Ankyrin repeat protein RF_0381 n=1 Tax=Durusdinium trenchii TaxID=1381693 RepID=A0ABP0JKM2_9DINO